MGRFDQLLKAAGIAPRRAAKPAPRKVILAKAMRPAEAFTGMPEDPAALRHELESAISAGLITAIDARDIMHQLDTGNTPTGDLATKLKAVLRASKKRQADETPALRDQLARAVKAKALTAADAAKVEHLLNVGAELPDDLKIAIGKHAK